MLSRKMVFLATALVFIGLAGCEKQVSYSADVQPILDKYCISCHANAGEGEAASGFAVDDYEAVMQGTQHGPVVVAGSSMSSSLYLVVAMKTDPKIHMPPHHDDSMAEGRGFALSETNIKLIRDWIDQGARNN